MGDEVVGLDVERATRLAVACGAAGRLAGDLAAEVRQALSSGLLPIRGAVLLSEVEYELTTLRRVVDGTVERVRLADAFWVLRPRWVAERLRLERVEWSLWDSLNDSSGAAAIDVGPFGLAESFRLLSQGEWRAAIGRPGCESFGPGRYYTGGGALLGPDNRLYPVVVPHLVVDDQRHFTIDADIPAATPSAASLGGADPGWAMIHYRTGVERIESEPALGWRVLTGVAVATGFDVRAPVDERHLTGIHLQAGSRPRFSGGVGAVPTAGAQLQAGGWALTAPESTVWATIDGRTAHYRISDLPGDTVRPAGGAPAPTTHAGRLGRINTAGDVLSLATGVVSGFVAGRDLDDSRHRAYEVVFEEHPDGRRRARVQTFTLERGPDGVGLYGWHLFVDPDGDLHQSPTSYQQGDSAHPPELLLANNPYDPDFTSRLPAAAFGGIAESP